MATNRDKVSTNPNFSRHNLFINNELYQAVKEQTSQDGDGRTVSQFINQAIKAQLERENNVFASPLASVRRSDEIIALQQANNLLLKELQDVIINAIAHYEEGALGATYLAEDEEE